MNLTKLFEMQKVLDERINKEKGLEGQDLLPQKILALLVELGELANEWRGFKFWSKRQFPTNLEVHSIDKEGNVYYRNTLLEEYVDCLHFLLSIGLELSVNTNHIFKAETYHETVTQFNRLYRQVGALWDYGRLECYYWVTQMFIGLGEMLGFTWDQIEQGYYDKNKINHARQESGY